MNFSFSGVNVAVCSAATPQCPTTATFGLGPRCFSCLDLFTGRNVAPLHCGPDFDPKPLTSSPAAQHYNNHSITLSSPDQLRRTPSPTHRSPPPGSFPASDQYSPDVGRRWRRHSFLSSSLHPCTDFSEHSLHLLVLGAARFGK